jgi:hypothetical protein
MAGNDSVQLPPADGEGARQERRYFKNVRRFGYWEIAEVNPGRTVSAETTAIEAHRYLETYFEELQGSDETAVFQFARADAWAFRSAWVVALVERWRGSGDVASLRRLVKDYAGARGKRTQAKDLIRIIQRDQKMFRGMLGALAEQARFEVALLDVAEKFQEAGDSSESQRAETIRLVYREYRPYYESRIAANEMPDKILEDLETMVNRMAVLL